MGHIKRAERTVTARTSVEKDAVLADEVMGYVTRELAGPSRVIVQLHPEVKVVQHMQLPEHLVRVPVPPTRRLTPWLS